MLDVAAAIDQDADLSANLPADLGQPPREFLREQRIGGDAAPGEALEPANLAGFEAVRIAEDLDGRLLRTRALIDALACEAAIHLARRIELGEHVRPFLFGTPAGPGVGHLLERVDPA